MKVRSALRSIRRKVAIGLLVSFAAGCTLFPDPLHDVEQQLKNIMAVLTTQSSEWQHEFEKAEANLIGEANDIVKDLGDIVTEAEGAAVAEAMCYTDFVRQRVFQTVVLLMTAVVTGKSYKNIPVPRAPTVCVVSPTSLDPVTVANNQHNEIDFFGYDFKNAPFQVFLDDVNGNPTDVTGPPGAGNLAIESDYVMVLNLGANGVHLPTNPKDIRLVLNGDTVSTVPIIAENVPLCTLQTEFIKAPSNVQITGRHKDGDSDYAGHGPVINATIDLDLRSDGLYARASFAATETQGDWTSSAGSQDWFKIANPPSGGSILQVYADPNTNESFTHASGSSDTIDVGGTKPVKQLTFDSLEGGSAADRTSMNITWQEIQVVELAPPNQGPICVPPGGQTGSGGSPPPTPPPGSPSPSPRPTPPPNPCTTLSQLRPNAGATVIVKRFLGPAESALRQCP